MQRRAQVLVIKKRRRAVLFRLVRVRALEDGHRAEVSKRVKGEDACIISERDDDNALFGAVDVLEALIASYGPVGRRGPPMSWCEAPTTASFH